MSSTYSQATRQRPIGRRAGGKLMAQGRDRRVTKGFVVLHARFSKEADQWVGECLELGTATQADTIEDLQVELRDLIGLHLNTLEKNGQRARFFKEHGIKMYKTNHTVPQNVSAMIPVMRKNSPESFVTAAAVPVHA